MIIFENQLYLEFPSKRDFIDLVSNKVISSINNIAQEVHSEKMNENPALASNLNIFGFGMNLSIDEALKNAIVHGNKADPRKKVVLSYYINEDKLEIMVRDEGIGFDHKSYRPVDEVDAEAGRGLMLIRNFMDEVNFNDSGNEIIMIKYIGKNNSSREVL